MTAVRELRPVGREYLQLVTDLLQRQRLADPFAGLFEAADLQWWYTRDPHPTDRDAVVWLSGDVPTAAAVFSRWTADRYKCAVLGDLTYPPAWAFVRTRCAELAEATIDMEIEPADAGTAAEATRAGFADLGETYEVMWLDAADRAAPSALPEGFVLQDRSVPSGVHPMVTRNGAEVENRLRDCPLYDPGLDLAMLAPSGEVAGYAMFWADLRTGVGMVEPMRIEDAYAGQGLGRVLLRDGLARLAARGCARLKVLHDVANLHAARLYSGAGFVAQTHGAVYRRPPRAAATPR